MHFLTSLIHHRKYITLYLCIYFLAGFNLNELKDKNLVAFTQGWKEVLDMITSEKVHPRVDSVWQFEDIVDAFKQMSERKNIGKVVVKP